jgi:hypothetical protein
VRHLTASINDEVIRGQNAGQSTPRPRAFHQVAHGARFRKFFDLL